MLAALAFTAALTAVPSVALGSEPNVHLTVPVAAPGGGDGKTAAGPTEAPDAALTISDQYPITLPIVLVSTGVVASTIGILDHALRCEEDQECGDESHWRGGIWGLPFLIPGVIYLVWQLSQRSKAHAAARAASVGRRVDRIATRPRQAPGPGSARLQITF